LFITYRYRYNMFVVFKGGIILMDKIAMINNMIKGIEADPSLDISKWVNTLYFIDGELKEMTLEDLNGVEMPNMPERDLTNLTAVEMLVVSASKCFATRLELEAYKAYIPLNEVTITFIGKFAKAPFLSLREGNSGLHEPHIELTVVSSVEQDKIEHIAKQSVKLSPVLSSLNDPVTLVVN